MCMHACVWMYRSNMTGPKRTWLQVKLKYKNILQNGTCPNKYLRYTGVSDHSYFVFCFSSQKDKGGTGGGSPKADLTSTADIVIVLKKSRAVLDGIRRGK